MIMFFFRKKRDDIKIYAYDDIGQRGRDLVKAARRIGIDSCLFTESADVPNEPEVVAYLHVAINKQTLQKAMSVMKDVSLMDRISLIPRAYENRLFFSKIRITEAYSDWMPATYIIRDRLEAKKAIERLGLPFISKSDRSHASVNVRLIKGSDDADAEVEQVFSEEGMSIAYGQRQKGYLYWQEFMPGNDGDWRVVTLAQRYAYAFRRFNRENVPLASGSGSFKACEHLTDEVREMLDYGMDFSVRNKRYLVTMDLLKDKRGKPIMIEVHCTLGRMRTGAVIFEHRQGKWSPTRYKDHQFYDVMAKAISDGDFN